MAKPIMDWLGIFDDLFSSIVTFTTDLAANGNAFAFLLVGFIAVALFLWVGKKFLRIF